jgi:VWFA-related protein
MKRLMITLSLLEAVCKERSDTSKRSDPMGNRAAGRAYFCSATYSWWLVVCVVVLALTFAPAQDVSGQTAQPPVFRTESRLVLLDVVVLDANGTHVHGLKAEDFTVLDNHEPQQIRFFDELRPDVAVQKEPARFDLPPGVYSNWTSAPTAPAINIVVFDLLNMDFQTQAFARWSLVEFLKKLPPGQQIALYILGDKLRLIENPTGNTELLIAAANKLSTVLAGPARENVDAIYDWAEHIKAGTELAEEKAMIDQVRDAMLNAETAKASIRAQGTSGAIQEIVRSTAYLRRRKNLIWISGAFPSLSPAMAKLVADAQVAFYPIDARGLLTLQVGAERSGQSVLTGPEYARYLSRVSSELNRIHDSMQQIAQETGGRAFYNTNGISDAIATSVKNGSSYYTLAFKPTDEKWDGALHRLDVKVLKGGLTLFYRRSYYALPEPLMNERDARAALMAAVQPNVPQSTMLIMKAQVVGGSDPNKPLELQYVVDAHGLSFSESPSGKRSLRLQVVAVAWDKQGNNAGEGWQEISLDLPTTAVEELLRDGVRSHRPIILKPGTYQLRLGIIDTNSGKIGTVDMPVTSVCFACNVPKRWNPQRK